MSTKTLFASLVFVLLVLTGCVPQSENTITPVTSVTPIPPTQIPEPEFLFNPEIQARGKVVILDHLNLSFPMPGLVIELLVEQGDFVQKGDVIARLDASQLIADIARAEGEVALAQAILDRVAAGPHEAEIQEVAIAVTAVAGQRVLTVPQATSQAFDLAAAQAQLDILLAQPYPEDVAVAHAELKQAQLNLEASKALLDRATLTAPSDGTVTEVFVKAYEYANTGQTIVQVSNLSDMTVQVGMDDLEVARIDIGETLLVTFEALPDVQTEGRVLNIMPNIESGNERDFIVLLGLETIPNGVRWGMTATVIIPPE